jgi:hypothetical protein
MSAINTIDSGSGAIALTFISFLRRPKWITRVNSKCT